MSEPEIGRLSALIETLIAQADRRDRIIEGLVSEQNMIMQDLVKTIARYENTVQTLDEVRTNQTSQRARSDDHQSRISNIEVAKQAMIWLGTIFAPIAISGLGTAIWVYWSQVQP